MKFLYFDLTDTTSKPTHKYLAVGCLPLNPVWAGLVDYMNG
jgi:hypothetical protein